MDLCTFEGVGDASHALRVVQEVGDPLVALAAGESTDADATGALVPATLMVMIYVYVPLAFKVQPVSTEVAAVLLLLQQIMPSLLGQPVLDVVRIRLGPLSCRRPVSLRVSRTTLPRVLTRVVTLRFS